jgi:hypothetical protein
MNTIHKENQHYVIDIEDLFVSSSSDESDNVRFRQTSPININHNNNIKIENIAGEQSLIEYTKQHFNTNMRHNYSDDFALEIYKGIKYNENYYCSDSPITMSNNNSDDENDEEKEPSSKYKKITYDEMEKIIINNYDNENKYSDELDILITYLKGQKVLYTYSNRITRWKLNMLTIPSLVFTASIAIFSPFMQNYEWSIELICVLNGLITLLISLVNYLKLESTAEIYLNFANQFDKLETSMEFTSNSIAFIENEKEKKELVLKKMKDVEKKITDMKESNNILIPGELKILFPVIFNINIFSFIKKIELSKKNLIMKLKNTKNEINYILYKYGSDQSIRQKNRLDFLSDSKEKLKTELNHYNNAYSYIDTIFFHETYYGEKLPILYMYLCCCCCKCTQIYETIKNKNPIVDDYLQFILHP